MQKIAETASSMLSCLLNNLVTYYLRKDAAAMPAIPWTQEEGVPLEAWVHISNKHVPESIRNDMKPQWHMASQEEVRPLKPYPTMLRKQPFSPSTQRGSSKACCTSPGQRNAAFPMALKRIQIVRG